MLAKKNLLKFLVPLMLIAAVFPVSAGVQNGVDMKPAAQESRFFDRDFIDFMVPAHQAVIEIANLGIQRTTREELRTFLMQQAQSAQQENQTLLEWREE